MLKFLFLTLLLLAFVAPLRRFLFWLVVGRQITNLQKKYQNQQTASPPSNRPEGEIKVDFMPKNQKNQGNSDGQYIDYEDVK